MPDGNHIICKSSYSLNNKSKKNIIPVYTKKIKNICDITRAGCSAPGIKKTNQDNYFVLEKLMNDPDSYYFGVCDGHGLHGHDISKFIKDTLPTEVNIQLLRNKDPSKRNYYIEQVFLNVNFKLVNDSSIDTTFSGSTCVSLICTTESLICANIGDSRAVLGRCIDGGI
jgi:serine/threonine protein phosphatase PrpC